LAMPSKRFTRTLVPFLTRAEVEALLAAPDQRTWRKRAPMSARFNCSSVIAVWRPPPGICASRPRRSAPPRAPSTCSPVPSGPRRLPPHRPPADARSWTVQRWRWRTSSAATATPIVTWLAPRSRPLSGA
jgi:hypothetical protein